MDDRQPTPSAFRDAEPDAVAAVAAIVRQAVFFRGFYIPREQRTDVVQEVMLELWRSTTDPSRETPRDFRAWIRTVAYRRCVDWVRRRRSSEPMDDNLAGSDPTPEARVMRAEDLELGCAVVERLRESCRELFDLHAVRRMSYREIAEVQGRTEKAVRNQMSDCLGQARDMLRKLRRRARLGLKAAPDSLRGSG